MSVHFTKPKGRRILSFGYFGWEPKELGWWLSSKDNKWYYSSYGNYIDCPESAKGKYFSSSSYAKSFKAARRKIRKSNLPKGMQIRISSRYCGHDVFMTKTNRPPKSIKQEYDIPLLKQVRDESLQLYNDIFNNGYLINVETPYKDERLLAVILTEKDLVKYRRGVGHINVMLAADSIRDWVCGVIYEAILCGSDAPIIMTEKNILKKYKELQ